MLSIRRCGFRINSVHADVRIVKSTFYQLLTIKVSVTKVGFLRDYAKSRCLFANIFGKNTSVKNPDAFKDIEALCYQQS